MESEFVNTNKLKSFIKKYMGEEIKKLDKKIDVLYENFNRLKEECLAYTVERRLKK